MQAEIWIAFAYTVAAIALTALVTWWGTRKTIENVTRSVAEIVSRNIGGAVREIHADIKASQEKLEGRLERKRSGRRG